MAQAKGDLYTLTQVSEETGISMPTLQRYKKLYQDRLPTVGEGRKQRYPEAALAVFEELKVENLKKRGRPRKNAAKSSGDDGGSSAKKAGRQQAAKKASAKSSGRSTSKRSAKASGSGSGSARGGASDLLTLKEIQNRTGISYPTLLRYVKDHEDDIPHEGAGRKRRYYASAVEVFQRIYDNSPRGRKSKRGPKAAGQSSAASTSRAASGSDAGTGALMNQIKQLRRAQKQLLQMVTKLERDIKKPFKVVVKR